MTALLIGALLAQFGGVRSIAQFRPLTSSSWTEPAKKPVSASSGCGTIPPVNGQFVTRTTDFSGATLVDNKGANYSYIIAVPSSAPTGTPDSTPHPVVFGFHGVGGSSSGAQAFGICSGTFPAANAICIFIQARTFQGVSASWDSAPPGRLQWWQPFGTVAASDTLVFDAVLADVEAHFCVNQNAVFVAGFSDGCDMVTSLASSRGSVIRAVSAASCAYAFWTTSDPTTYAGMCIANQSPCKGANLPGHITPSAQAPGYRFTHDPAGDGSYDLTKMTSTINMVKAHSGCSLVVSSAGSPCTEYQWCSARVVECTYPGLGHNPPPNWGPDTWDYFASYL